MALTAATPENLADFAEQLGQQLAEELGGGGQQPAGAANALRIDAFVKKDFGVESVDDPGFNMNHYYLGIDEGLSLQGIALRCFRRGRVRWRAATQTISDGGDEVKVVPKTVGYYETRSIDNSGVLFTLSFKSLQPVFTRNGKAFYEITVEDYESLEEFANSDFETGYHTKETQTVWDDENQEDVSEEVTVPMSIGRMLSASPRYLCLFKDGKRISNYARMTVVCDSDGRYRVGI